MNPDVSVPKTLCVFCSSSETVAPIFFEAATELGTLMAHQGYNLVYGGGRLGLMGAVARAVHQNGGQVIGVIPESIRANEIAYETADELVVTKGLRERKAIMEARAGAFVGLPGGFGTLEEILEILTLKQLGLHAKPIVLVNTRGFYDPLIRVFEQLYRERFARPEFRNLYHTAPDVKGVFSYLEGYQPVVFRDKWL